MQRLADGIDLHFRFPCQRCRHAAVDGFHCCLRMQTKREIPGGSLLGDHRLNPGEAFPRLGDGLVITQAAAADLDVTFFGVDGMDGIIAQMGEENAELTEGIVLLTPFMASSTDEKIASFVADYEKAYNATPDQFAADAYDAVYIIKAAMEQAGIEDVEDKELNEKLVAAMTEIKVEGVTGTMTWSADGEPTKSAQAVVIKNGVYEEY